MASIGTILRPLRQVHERIRDGVISAFERSDPSELAGIHRDGQGDTVYTVDAISEAVLLDQIDRHIAVHDPVVVIAEGLDPGGVVLPRGKSESDAIWRVIVDPIDGTRGLMYQKRSAWILTWVAPNKGPQTNLWDIELALQTEVPVLKQHLCDTLWAVRGGECAAERYDRISGRRDPLQLQPSRAEKVDHGFATIVRFFPGARCAGRHR